MSLIIDFYLSKGLSINALCCHDGLHSIILSHFLRDLYLLDAYFSCLSILLPLSTLLECALLDELYRMYLDLCFFLCFILYTQKIVAHDLCVRWQLGVFLGRRIGCHSCCWFKPFWLILWKWKLRKIACIHHKLI